MPLKRNDDTTSTQSQGSSSSSSSSTSGPKYTPSNGNNDFSFKKESNGPKIIEICGEGKSGKTAMGALYAPDPVVIINFDGRAIDTVEQARAMGRKVGLCEIYMPSEELSLEEAKAAAKECIKKVMYNLSWAVKDSRNPGGVRTIVIDTVSELSDIGILEWKGTHLKKGDKTDAFGQDQRFVKHIWWNITHYIRSGKANLIVTSRASGIWEDHKRVGNKPDAPSVVFDSADLVLYSSVEAEEDLRKKKINPAKFKLEVIGCGANMSELKAVYTADDWGDDGPFAYACHRQFSDTSEIEDWK